MQRITLKTKIEVTIVIAFLITLGAASVISVTRTISDTQDDVDTFIRNSNGNYWEATGDNIQVAIDNLGIQPPSHQGWGGVHGTICLPGNTTITTSSTITIEPHVTLDVGGSVIEPDGDFEVVNLTIGSQIKNGCINV